MERFIKKDYYNDTIREKKNNPKELWKFINSVIPSKCSVFPPPTQIKVVNTEIVNPDEIAEHLNNYFVEISHLTAKTAGSRTV